MLSKTDAIAKLKRQIDLVHAIKLLPRFSAEFKKWYRDTEIAIENIFGGETRHVKDFTGISYSLGAFSSNTPDSKFQERFLASLETAKQILNSMIEEIEEYWTDTIEVKPDLIKMRHVEQVCDRFHLVARQLRARHDSRPALEVEDEYDVQDLLHALLHLEFDDIRPEEWTPSYAGGSARVDFLLKNESIVVEVKKTRANFGVKQVGDQLLIDIGRYQSHQNCRTLICFVYDPEGRIANPRGFEADLSRTVNELDVRVFIRPTGL